MWIATNTARSAGRTDDHMGAMQHCSGIRSVTGLPDEMRIELDTHVATMPDEATLDDAKAESERHVDAMDGVLHDMGAILDTMHCPPLR